MKSLRYLLFWTLLIAASIPCAEAQTDTGLYKELYRPQLHFSPKAHWMNDPNGMVYNKGIYHLFFQYYPDGSTWGPMHWGHATSPDMLHWKEQAIALYPDSLGYIFSGSAVVDEKNTSGFGKKGQAPLVAIFTSHDPIGEKARTGKYENQSIAYSLDNGITWTKYAGNPVLKNPGIADFRDPKVMWYEASKKWIMTLATQDRITFYSSPNLKEWTRESEFGAKAGAHGGVWECPDLFPLTHAGKQYWILIVNINPGGPNGGSATQYFTGQFDGHGFTANHTNIKWLDYGPDEYAGITWSNTGKRKIFLGWMSNWAYAGEVPTHPWRSAMTIPRELGLANVNGRLLIKSSPVRELKKQEPPLLTITNNRATTTKGYDTVRNEEPYMLTLTADTIKDCSLVLSNKEGEQVIVGYDASANQYYIDRTRSGKTGFNKGFASRHVAPRFATNHTLRLVLVVDRASVELFADDGLTVMTSIFFSKSWLNPGVIDGPRGGDSKIVVSRLGRVWK
ncbi:glycoside hydrolase family 32 protein [Paraflavitalea soli]|uniref:Glycoside hydrolase family 32 protein n=1 Tax=Paraflavitalea soli TaxID=2315862 RepID=A0A3B7MHT5_9BACT|nr:glycoside hydrolase family 32 protein [Paraflavitalea soli]AXY72729.1 glycoside hydrolase family 32 protein [Paraflavitalea soli]